MDQPDPAAQGRCGAGRSGGNGGRGGWEVWEFVLIFFVGGRIAQINASFCSRVRNEDQSGSEWKELEWHSLTQKYCQVLPKFTASCALAWRIVTLGRIAEFNKKPIKQAVNAAFYG